MNYDPLNYAFLGNSLETWLIALAVATLFLLSLSFCRRLASKKVTSVNVTEHLRWDGFLVVLIHKTRVFFLFIFSIYMGSQLLALPPKAEAVFRNLAFLAFLVQVAIWGGIAINYWVGEYMRTTLQEDAAKATSVRAIGFLAKLVLLTVLILLGLDNFGINVTTLVAGLGVGGVAVALAVQNILGDLFASLTIVLDKPFVLGDSIRVGTDFEGTIEHIGLKTTRVRSISGEQLIFPNADLLQSRIRNFKRMQERRVLLNIGVPHDTPAEKLREIPNLIEAVAKPISGMRLERAFFKGLSPSSLDFEVTYWSELADTFQKQATFNLALLEAFRRANIRFAHPTQSLYLARDSRPVGTPSE